MLGDFTLRCQRVAGAYISDIVLGANDGIITTFAVVAGVAGAQLPGSVVIFIGFANLVADGISMGASNYLGTRSAEALDGEREGHENHAHPLNRGLMTLAAFVTAGIVPLIAYLLPVATEFQFPMATLLTGMALFSVGAARTFLIPVPWWKAGLEMFLIGALAAGGAYLVGMILRVLVGVGV